MAVVINTGEAAQGGGGFWDNYNILAAIGRIAKPVMRCNRFMALTLFAFCGLLFLVFGFGWLALDFLSTWDWTGTFFRPTLEASQGQINQLAAGAAAKMAEDAEQAAGAAATGAVAVRVVLQVFSMVPTIAELIGPFFARYDKIVASLIIAFSAFDYYTDWPTATKIMANASLTGWGAFAPIVRFLLTAALCAFNSMGLQYLAIFFFMATVYAAITILFGPREGRRAA